MGDCISWCNPVFKRVDELPPVEVATRNHTYITPDNKAYILNENGDGFIQFSSDVSMDMVEEAIRQIVAETELNLETANLTLEGRTLSWSGTLNDGRPFNSSITLPEDKDTLYDDTELKNRIQELENKPDNDTVYDDTELTNRVEALENKVDNDTKYTAGTGLTLTNNQFSADMNVLATKADTEDLGNRIYTLEQEVDDDTIYDDTELRERIGELETKADYNTTYTIEVKDGVATLVGSNGTRNEIGKVTDNDTIYDDTVLSDRVTKLEEQPIMRIAKGFLGKPIHVSLNKSDLMNPEEVKVGDIIKDFLYSPDTGTVTFTYREIVEVGDDRILADVIGYHDFPLPVDTDTTYEVVQQGDDYVLQGSDGSSVVIGKATGNNTTYTLALQNNMLVFSGSDGTVKTIPLQSTNIIGVRNTSVTNTGRGFEVYTREWAEYSSSIHYMRSPLSQSDGMVIKQGLEGNSLDVITDVDGVRWLRIGVYYIKESDAPTVLGWNSAIVTSFIDSINYVKSADNDPSTPFTMQTLRGNTRFTYEDRPYVYVSRVNSDYDLYIYRLNNSDRTFKYELVAKIDGLDTRYATGFIDDISVVGNYPIINYKLNGASKTITKSGMFQLVQGMQGVVKYFQTHYVWLNNPTLTTFNKPRTT